jgi:hypothetical protein
MTTHVYTDNNGRKHVTSEPLLHQSYREWVDLTVDEVIDIAKQTQTAEPGSRGYILPISFYRAIAQALKEKNT